MSLALVKAYLLKISMYKLVRFFSLFIVFTLVVSCTFTKQIKNGETAIDRKQYRVAIEFFEEEIRSSSSKEETAHKAFRLGECYTMVNEVDNATKWFDEAVRLDYGPKAYWALADNFKKKEAYQKAIGLYRLAGQEGYPANEVNREIKVCKQAILWATDEDDVYAINPIDANSLYSDYAPTFYDGGYIVFTSDRVQDASSATYNWTGNAYSDLFIVNKNGGEVLLFDSFLNTPNNEGPAVFDTDFDQIFFNRCASDEGDDHCKIMWSIKENGRWLEPQEPFTMEPGFNYNHPALIEEDSVLIFSSNLTGGEGAYDLFYSLLEDEGWSDPEPMPSRLNTMGNESFPTVDGDTLYYSSDFHPGLGGLDIFRSVLNANGEWSSPVNMKKPINSGSDDFGLIIDRQANSQGRYDYTGYFTSTRMADDSDNIFKLTKYFPKESENKDPEDEAIAEEEKKQIRIYLAGKVVADEHENDEDPNSLIVGKKILQGSDIGITTLIDNAEMKSDEKGRFYYDLIDNSSYSISVSKEGYFNKLLELDLEDISGKASADTTINLEIKLDKIFKGEEIVLDNIYYDLNKATLRQDALPALEELANMLNQNPNVNIQLSAHTDCRGTAFYNLNLSQRRANSVTRYLIESGIDQDRLKSKGFGKSSLAIECECDDCTEEEHQTNRRTTFKIL